MGTEYVMMAGCRGFLNSKYELTTSNEEKNEVYRADFILASLTKPVLIENIFYDFDRATLRPESTKALDELIKLLNDNPNVTIELAAHTDMKGADSYNLRLSERRAQSVVDYFFKEGDILTEEYILALPEEQQEIANQINRRTEFQVLKTTYDLF